MQSYDPKDKKQKICHQCQNKFDCNPHNCWCAELPKIIPIKDGEDCLCPECLKKEIAKRVV